VYAVEVTYRDGYAQVNFSSPVLRVATLRELATRLSRLARESSPMPVILTSSHPRIFLAGADLADIATLDRHSCVAYAELGRRAVGAIESHPSPTVAAVDGSCSGGGFDLVLACDAVIASPRASFSHPGVRRGLVTGWGGTTDLPPRLTPSVARKALLEGARVTLPALVEAGVVRTIADTPVAAATECARQLSDLHPSRLRLWRRLRHGTGSALLGALLTRGIID